MGGITFLPFVREPKKEAATGGTKPKQAKAAPAKKVG